MIRFDNLSLDETESLYLQGVMSICGASPSLDQVYNLVDEAWRDCSCDNQAPEPKVLDNFYRHPFWVFYGLFVEQHDLSMEMRRAIAKAVVSFKPNNVLDLGGGFGTLARIIAAALPGADIAICEPYPPRYGIESCKSFTNIRFVPELSPQSLDVLVSTDVLEHVPDPLGLLAAMVDAVRPGGHLFIANCFYPVILCHLPCTFHLRYSFDDFCRALGLEVLGPCKGSHATVYRRTHVVKPDWQRLWAMERRSQRLFPWREWKASHLSPWGQRAQLAMTQPLHYPRKLARALRATV